MKVDVLRKRYPRFIYRNYDHKISGGNLDISFVFEIPPDVSFRPKLIIKSVPTPDVGTLTVYGDKVFNHISNHNCHNGGRRLFFCLISQAD